MTGLPEGAGAVREEDAFDVEAVAAWLRSNAEAPFRDFLDGTPEVWQFAGGASNLTYLLRYPRRDLILRRAPRGTKARRVRARSAPGIGRSFSIRTLPSRRPAGRWIRGSVGATALANRSPSPWGLG